MPLPEIIPCKVSDEGAGYVTMTAVAREDLAARDLVSKIVSVSGKDAPRVQRILARGSLVSGDSRYRWVGVAADTDEIDALLALLPSDDPARPFDVSHCTQIVFRGPRGELELDREPAREKRLLKRKNFWDEAMALVAAEPSYERYSYSDAADVYVAVLSLEQLEALRAAASLLRYTTLEDQVSNLQATHIALHVPRT